MSYTVRWERAGKVYLCATEDTQTAEEVQRAVAAFWSDDEISVQIWEGLDMLKEVVS